MKGFVNGLKKFWKDEQGMGTLEIILIIAVIVVIAVLFKNYIIGWVKDILGSTDSKVKEFQNPSAPPAGG